MDRNLVKNTLPQYLVVIEIPFDAVTESYKSNLHLCTRSRMLCNLMFLVHRSSCQDLGNYLFFLISQLAMI